MTRPSNSLCRRLLLPLLAVLAVAWWLPSCDRSDRPAPGVEVANVVDTLLAENLAPTEAEADSSVLTPSQRDSLEFRLLHHYSEGYNFRVTADSIVLVPRSDELPMADTCTVYRKDLVAVVEVNRQPAADSLSADTFWVKVAHDQFTMGWVEETQLLGAVTPDDSISALLRALTTSRGVWMTAVVALGLLGFLIYKGGRPPHQWLSLLRGSNSLYAPLLLSWVLLLAVTYAGVQLWVPEFWQEYYFHPTLNPLLLPGVMAWMVTLVWLVVITFIALVIETYHRFYFVRGMVFLLETLGVAMVLYLLVSWTARIYVGFLLAALLMVGVWLFFFYKKGTQK